MLKTSSSQQVESGQTKGISQRVESDASPPSPDSFVSFRMRFVVTQYKHHVHEEEDTEDIIEDPKPKGQFKDSIAAHKPQEEYTKAGMVF